VLFDGRNEIVAVLPTRFVINMSSPLN